MTNRPTNRPTDKAGCRVACTRLKIFILKSEPEHVQRLITHRRFFKRVTRHLKRTLASRSQGLALDGQNDLFDEMLPAMSEAEAEVFKFLEECPRGEDAAGAKIIFWEITRELEREILIKVGQCF